MSLAADQTHGFTQLARGFGFAGGFLLGDFAAFAWRQEQVRLQAVLLGVQDRNTGRAPRTAIGACRARQCGPPRPPESGRRGEWSRAGARSRTWCALASDTRGLPGSALRIPNPGWTWLRPESGCAGSARMARAMETRCRCPPESLTPRSPTMVSYCFSKPAANSSTRAMRQACMICSSVASGREKATFSRIVPSNRNVSCSTTPSRVR